MGGVRRSICRRRAFPATRTALDPVAKRAGSYFRDCPREGWHADRKHRFVTPDAFTSIMRQRLAKTRGRANTYDYGLAKALVVIAKEWVKPDARVVAELKRLLSRVPAPPAGLTPKNTALLGIFDNPEVLARLHALPSELMAEAERAPRSLRSLAKAQAAVAIFVALYAPVRPSNLAALKLGETLFIGNRDDRESVVELPEEVVKNGDAFGTVLPPEVTTLLRRYRDHFLTPLLGREPTYLFDNGSGSPKLATTLSGLVQRTIYRRLGFKMGLHQFRHVGAKTLLDEDPSAHEAVRQLLGHNHHEFLCRARYEARSAPPREGNQRDTS